MPRDYCPRQPPRSRASAQALHPLRPCPRRSPPRLGRSPASSPRRQASPLRADGFVLRDGARISVSQDPEAARIAAYFAELLRASHGIALRVQARGGARVAAAAIVLRLDAAAPQREESYRLEVSRAGVLVTARAPRGLFYGAVTLWQLCSARRLQDGGLALPARVDQRCAALPLARPDARLGAPLSVARVHHALHRLDGAAQAQRARLAPDRRPGLAARDQEVPAPHRVSAPGACRPGARRSATSIRRPAGRAGTAASTPRTQVRRIVAHAAARYVTIVPEIDMPGHATRGARRLPAARRERSDPPRAVPADWGIYPNLFNVEESTFAFIEDVLDEVMALFPGAVHPRRRRRGGQGSVAAPPRACRRACASSVSRTRAALQGYFTQRLGDVPAAPWPAPVGWDEILAGGRAGGCRRCMSWRGVRGRDRRGRERATTRCCRRTRRSTWTTARAAAPQRAAGPRHRGIARGRVSLRSAAGTARRPRRSTCSACRRTCGPSTCAPRSAPRT